MTQNRSTSYFSEREIISELLEVTQMGTWRWDVKTGEVILSEGSAKNLGYTVEELGSMTIDSRAELTALQDRELFRETYKTVFSPEENSYTFVGRMHHKEGHFIWVKESGKVVKREEDGSPALIVGVHSDVSDLYESKKQIATESERFRTLYDGAPVALLIHDADTGELLDANTTALRAYGAKTFEELKNAEVGHGASYGIDELLGWIKKAVEEGPQEFEWMGQRLDGIAFWEQIIFAPIFLDNTLRVMSTTIDINHRKQVEEENLEVRKFLGFTNAKQRIMMDISNSFMKAEASNLKKTVQESLALIGRTINSDRVFIFRYDLEKQTASNEFEWCAEGVSSEIRNLQNLPIESLSERYERHIQGKSVLISDFAELSPKDAVRRNLEFEPVKSSLSVPMEAGEFFLGFVGMANIHKDIQYTTEDENILREYANALMSTLYRIETSKRLSDREALLRMTLLSIGDGVISTDKDGNITNLNRVAELLTGYTQSEAQALPFEKIFNIYSETTKEPLGSVVKEVLATGRTLELDSDIKLVDKHGKELEIENSAAPITDKEGNILGAVVVFRNCTEKREKQREIEYLSMHDVLTGLYNRRYIEKVLEEINQPKNYPLTLMFADINGLKLTNDAFGHDMGDKLLKLVAKILKDVARPTDILGRIGGDEFIICFPNTTEEEALAIKHQIRKKTTRAKLGSIVVSVAMGFATKDVDKYSIEEIKMMAENRMYKNKLRHGKTMRSRTIETVLRNINNKYDSEQIHTERVSQITEVLARALGLTVKEIMDYKTAGALHDIGKITLPPEILNKPGKLTSREFEKVKQHTETGYQILKSVDEYTGLAEIVLHHHERWDGNGYPQGLKEEDIPLGARIISIADAFEAMTASRSYQVRRTPKEALEEMIRCSGTQFDPNVIPVLVKAFEEDQEVLLADYFTAT